MKLNNLCRKCGTKSVINMDYVALGDIYYCEVCHEEMFMVSFNCYSVRDTVYRNVEFDTEANYLKFRGFSGVIKKKKVKGTVVKKTAKGKIAAYRQVRLNTDDTVSEEKI